MEEELLPLGATTFKPETYFFWHPGRKTTVETTQLPDQHLLIQASKTYRLLKQSEEGRETRNQNLAQLREHLEKKFQHFQITVDYANHVHDSLTGIQEETQPLADEYTEAKTQKHQLIQEIQNLENAVQHGFEQLKPRLEQQLQQKQRELEQVENRLEQLHHQVLEKKHASELWNEHGNSLAYLFTFTTTPTVIHQSRLEDELPHILDAADDPGHGVKQTLEGSQMQLYVEELDQPRIFHRRQYTSLLRPEAFQQLKEQAPDHLQQSLDDLQQQHLKQYFAYSPVDLETAAGRSERGKQTPSQAVRSLIKDLDTVQRVGNPNAPNDGPTIGTVTGTQQVVGFDPADTEHNIPHMLIVGGTGSGKTYLKRVLIENTASLGYDILSITPSDRQSIGISTANPDHENGTGLAANHFLESDNRLLTLPPSDDLDQLFTGVNILTLDTMHPREKQDYITKIFQRLDDLGKRSKPLYIFIEEAHEFAEGTVADVIENISREGRKFGLHLVLVTQEPTDFSHGQAVIRKQLPHVFMRGRYTQYASQLLDSNGNIVTQLDQGQTLFFDWSHGETLVDVRKPLTKVDFEDETAEEKLIDKLDQKYRGSNIEEVAADLNTKITKELQQGTAEKGKETFEVEELTEKEQEVLDWVHQYIKEEDRPVTYSKAMREGGFGGNADQHLENLVEKDRLEKDTEDFPGNPNTTVYKPR